MHQLLSRGISTINEKNAVNLLTLNTLPGQRFLRPRHIKYLSECISNGTFLTGDIATVRMDFDHGTEVLINGQHQLTAVILAKKPIEVVLEKYACDSEADLSLLYRQFDNHATRSLGDITKPEAIALGLEWPLRITYLILSAAILINHANDMPKAKKIEYLKQYLKQGSFVVSVLPKVIAEYQHMFRKAVIAAMILTWEKSHEKSYDFWLKVRDGENLKREMPSYRLRNYLQKIVAGDSRHTSRSMATPHEILSKCITGWNAFRKEQTTDLKYYPDKPIPKPI